MPKHKTMRITGGRLVRRLFLVPKAVDTGSVRPTPDRVREAIFSMLFDDLPDARVLDLFAGSGAHGFEALSRGARNVCFVEADPNVADVVKENIKLLDLASQCRVEVADARNFVSRTFEELADIIFVDPPYTLDLNSQFFLDLTRHLSEKGVVVYRCFKKNRAPIGDMFRIDRDRIYGGTRVFLLRRALSIH